MEGLFLGLGLTMLLCTVVELDGKISCATDFIGRMEITSLYWRTKFWLNVI